MVLVGIIRWVGSESFEEREQLVGRMASAGAGVDRLDAGEGLFLDGHVGVEVDLCSGEGDVGDQEVPPAAEVPTQLLHRIEAVTRSAAAAACYRQGPTSLRKQNSPHLRASAGRRLRRIQYRR